MSWPWRLLIQFVVLAACVALLLWRVDVPALWTALDGANWRLVLLAVPLVAASKVMHGLRWWLLVRRRGPVPPRDAVLVLLAATGVSVLLPLRAGAVLQVQVLGRRYGIERSEIAGTLLAEGLLDAMLLLLLALIAMLIFGVEGTWLRTAGVLAGVIGLVTLLLLVTGRTRLAGAMPLSPRLRERLASITSGVLRGLATLGNLWSVLALLLATAGDWVLASTASWLVGQAFGLDIPPYAYLVVEIVTNLVGAVPISQSSVGTYEVAVQQTLAIVGAGPSIAAAFAVANHAAIIVAEAAAGLTALWFLRLHWRDLFYLRAGSGPGTQQSPPQCHAVRRHGDQAGL